MTKYRRPDFGFWVRTTLKAAGIRVTALAEHTGIVYQTISRVLHEGTRGRPSWHGEETVRKIADALVDLGAIDNPAEAWIAAGYEVEGYVTVEAGSVLPEQLGALWCRLVELPAPVRERLLGLWSGMLDLVDGRQAETPALERELAARDG